MDNRITYKIKKQSLIVFLLFIIYPLASLPFLIMAMLRREKYGFILFGLFMGLFGLLVPPTGDFYRYTQDAYIIKDLNWNDFLLFSSLKFDFLLIYLSYGLSYLNLNFDLSRFIYNSISYILLGLLYLKLVNSNKNIQKKDWILLAIFITFVFSTFIFRFFFSMILFLYGSYNIIFYKKKTGWFFVILSVLNHVTYIIFLVGLILSQFNIFHLKKQVILILCCLSFIIDSSIMVFLMNYMPINIINRFMVYLDGYWAGDFLNDHSIKYKIMLLIGSGVVYSSIIIYYFIYNTLDKNKTKLSNYILLIVVLTTPFVTINGRFLEVFFYNFKILFLRYYQNNHLYKKCKYILLFMTIIATLSGLWANRRQWSLGDGHIILHSSFPSIITHTYSRDWINSHIYEDGDFVN